MKYKLSDILEYVLFIKLIIIFRSIPYKISKKIGEMLFYLVYLMDKKHRKVAHDNLSIAFKNDKNEEEIGQIIKDLYRNMGKWLVEFICIPKFKGEKIFNLVEFEGKQNFANALAKGKGAVVIVPHFGNWELAGATFPKIGKSLAIAFPQANPLTDNLINKIRKSSGIGIAYTGAGVKSVLKALKNNTAIGFLADQNVGDGVFVNFFGRLACTAKGPIAIALKTGAPVIMGVMLIQPNGKYKLHVTEEIPLAITGDTEKDIIVNTQKWTTILENFIRQYPDQWFWVHRRWKTQPEEGTQAKRQ